MRGSAAKNRRGCRRGCLLTTLGLTLLFAVVMAFFSRFGGFGTGPSAPTDEFARYAQPVSELEIPEGTRVVALGEATHGNREFQELKLDVFKVLVERYGVRAFALEADFGGAEAVNRYIHGGAGTAQEAAADLIFTLYRTDQMAELIAWMRSYNETAASGDDLRIYGFDMQSYEYSLALLVEKARGLGLDVADLEGYLEADDLAEHADIDQLVTTYDEVKQQLEALPANEDSALALHAIDCLQQNIELGKLMDKPEGYGARDGFMAQNVLWILDQEEQRGKSCIFVSAHNGHIEQRGIYAGSDMLVMGNSIANELGDAYYAIGTDFHKATVNLPKEDGRMTHTFYSYDPLAHAAATCGFETCWLDFARVPKDSPLSEYLEGPIMMGNVGEGFTPLMYVLPQAYRVKREPVDPYDSMIFVPYAHPTEIVAPSS